jgi:diacylglycerol kinase
MGMGWAIRLSFGQMVALGSFACIGLTWEMANTSIESLMNILHPSFSPKVKVVKDAFGAAPVIAFSVFLVLFVVFLGTKVMG